MSRSDTTESSGHGMKLADFLMQRLYEAGIRDVFAVAGDFILGLLDRVTESKLNLITCCNELNAAYAADGYARINGIGAVATTYAVGELSATNGIAGAFAECVPVVKIVGVPARRFFDEKPLLHHTLGDYMTPMNMYRHITVAQAFLTNPESAAAEIDRVLKACFLQKRPVYIAVPSDMVQQWIPTPEGSWHAPKMPKSDPASLTDCLEELTQKIQAAKKPIFIPGVNIIRRNMEGLFKKLTEKTNIPYVTMLLSKGILDEDHPHFIGLYSGDRSRPAVKQLVDESDCVIILGEKLTDFNTGGFTAVFDRKKRVTVAVDHVVIKSHQYNQVFIRDVIEGLIAHLQPFSFPPYPFTPAKHGCVHRVQDAITNGGIKKTDGLTMNSLFELMPQFLFKDGIVLAETGASLFSAAETMLPRGSKFIGQTFYGSIGFSVGACFGAAIAGKLHKRGRPVLFVGDGSFQLTCQEVSSMIRYKLNPIIILINNDGYTIERVITDNIYNDIQMWRYADLPQIFGGIAGKKVATIGEFIAALDDAAKDTTNVKVIEVVLDRYDCNQLLKDAGRTMAINNSLTPVDWSTLNRK